MLRRASRAARPETPGSAARAHLLLGRSLEYEGHRDAAEAHYRRRRDVAATRRPASAPRGPCSSPAPDGRGATARGSWPRRGASARPAKPEAALEAYRAGPRPSGPRCREAALRVAEERPCGRAALRGARCARRATSRAPRTRAPLGPAEARLLQAEVRDAQGDRASRGRAYTRRYSSTRSAGRSCGSGPREGLRSPVDAADAAVERRADGSNYINVVYKDEVGSATATQLARRGRKAFDSSQFRDATSISTKPSAGILEFRPMLPQPKPRGSEAWSAPMREKMLDKVGGDPYATPSMSSPLVTRDVDRGARSLSIPGPKGGICKNGRPRRRLRRRRRRRRSKRPGEKGGWTDHPPRFFS